jgi:hypothetical protein
MAYKFTQPTTSIDFVVDDILLEGEFMTKSEIMEVAESLIGIKSSDEDLSVEIGFTIYLFTKKNGRDLVYVRYLGDDDAVL